MNALLELAVNAHGGMERWQQITSIDARVSLSGQLYGLKGFPEGVPDVLMRLDTRQPAVAISPYGGVGHVGHFRPDRVWISDGAGKVVEERQDPRASFAGHSLMSRWDNLQRLYFTSYAMWNYLTTPFLLTRPGFEIEELKPHQEAGETWRCLRVKFPADVPTHCSEQIFYFDEKGLLQRLDYVTDVAGGVAAHYTYDHTWFGGLLFPGLRRVVRRTAEGPKPSQPTAVLIQISDIALA